MNDKEQLDKIYDAIIDDKDLTTKELISYGVSSYELSKMVKDGTLERVKRGLYKLNKVDGLYYYGRNLLKEKHVEKAKRCFEECLKLSPEHGGACFQLFYRALQDNNQSSNREEAFNYLKLLKKCNLQYEKDYNLYLYLFDYVYGVPEEYKNDILNIKYENIKTSYNDLRCKDVLGYNRMKTSIINKNFSLALRQLEDYTNKFGYSPLELVISFFLKQAKRVSLDNQKQIMQFIKNKDYNGLQSYLITKQSNQTLTIKEENILALVNSYIKIKKELLVPTPSIDDTLKTREAIDGNNYFLALELSKKYATKHNIPYVNSEMILLLEDICELIKYIEENMTTNNRTRSFASKEREVQLEAMIEKMHKIVIKETGMVLLDVLPKEDRNSVRRIVREKYPDMHARGIGCGREKRMILRYKTSEKINMKELDLAREKAYAEKRFKECLGISFQMLSCNEMYLSMTDSSRIYATIGKIFYIFTVKNEDNKEKYRKKAIDYLTVANELSKEGCGKYDFTDKIEQLMYLSSEEKKPTVKMNEDSFLGKTGMVNGISSLGGLVSIMYLLGYDIDTVCSGLGFSKSNVDIIKLELAKQCYIHKYNELGDAYYKQVEKSANKTKQTKRVMCEIQQDRRFYQNRHTENDELLVKKLQKIWVHTTAKK